MPTKVNLANLHHSNSLGSSIPPWNGGRWHYFCFDICNPSKHVIFIFSSADFIHLTLTGTSCTQLALLCLWIRYKIPVILSVLLHTASWLCDGHSVAASCVSFKLDSPLCSVASEQLCVIYHHMCSVTLLKVMIPGEMTRGGVGTVSSRLPLTAVIS